jgi:threonyl-tRNA synthetase
MDNQEKLSNLRHSTAHLLAAAILELYPDTKRAIGPAIETGFYYDFDFSKPITEDDFTKIEQRMHEILKTWDGFERKEISNKVALKQFNNEPYKLELIEEFSKAGDKLTIYRSGSYEDLCRGGHSENPKVEIGAFKLLSIAGAYWRGSEKNKMLTRVYGTAFPTKKELDDYLLMLEEAKKRDHRKLGKELDLFIFSPLVGGGLPLWTPKGTIVREELDDYIWSLRKKIGYQKVTIPHITKKDLYEKSGHWEKFINELFKIETREGDWFALKPMNCPHHIQIFANKPHSYRELPIRYCETTMCYRDEQTGELNGLSRVRAFTQDDAHVFLRKSQIENEFLKTWDIIDQFYGAFGFKMRVRLSLHDPLQMKNYLGDEKTWEIAEDQLRKVVKIRGSEVFEAVGEAAMYGPKLDFMTSDALGREWQVATIQLDLNMPRRFELNCINEEGIKEDIVMMHCAVMGSIERFTSILIEHLAGAFPLWLAPVQIELLPIADRHIEYAEKIYNQLNKLNIRVNLNTDKATLQAKIRNATLQKVPFMGIIGDRESANSKEPMANWLISIRTREGADLGQKNVKLFIDEIKEKIDQKT